jgi:hypothetical protein
MNVKKAGLEIFNAIVSSVRYDKNHSGFRSQKSTEKFSRGIFQTCPKFAE